jgi:hypothetical protein
MLIRMMILLETVFCIYNFYTFIRLFNKLFHLQLNLSILRNIDDNYSIYNLYFG